MKKIFLFALIAAFSFVGVSSAEEGEMYVGAKTGLMMVDVSSTDDIIPLGVVYGHSLEHLFPNLWVEGEFNYGLTGGDIDSGPASGEVSIWTLAGYAVYRYPLGDAAYLKGKAGLLYERAKVEIDDYTMVVLGIPLTVPGGSETDSDFNLSVGIGAGYKINDRITVEAEFTIIESDVDFLSVGLNYKF